LGILKYPNIYSKLKNIKVKDHPPKCIYDSELEILEWILSPFSQNDKELFTSYIKNDEEHHETLYKSLDCSIMEIADDISYGVHDLEDAVKYNLINNNDLFELFDRIKNYNINKINILIDDFSLDKYSSRSLKKLSSSLIKIFINNVNMKENNNFDHPLLKYNASLEEPYKSILELIKNKVKSSVIFSDRIRHITHQGCRAIKQVFEAFTSDERMLPKNLREKINHSNSENDRYRVICDHISGMTDTYLKSVYNRMFTFDGDFFMHL
jgi:dGTPase